MGDAPAGSAGLRAALVGPTSLWRGELACGALRVENGSGSPARVSARLNLVEGDVRLVVTQPDGSVKRAYASHLVDSAARTVDLPPGQALESGLLLLHAHTGPLFDEPGTYQVVAHYDARPGTEPVITGPLRIEARSPKSKPEVELGRLLLEKDVAVSFESGQPATPAAEKALASIASRFADRREGRAARLLLAASEADEKALDAVIADIVSVEGPVEAARVITALLTPAAPNAALVREAARERFERSRAKGARIAAAIVSAEPFDPGRA